MTPVFDDETRAAFLIRHGVDPEQSYRELLLDVRVGGPVYQRLVRTLGIVDRRPLWLSPRQRDAIIDVACGLTNDDSAAKRCLSPHTVKELRGDVIRRMGARSSAQAAVLCLVLGLLDEPAVGAVAA